jgi:hypothetical protein
MQVNGVPPVDQFSVKFNTPSSERYWPRVYKLIAKRSWHPAIALYQNTDMPPVIDALDPTS